MFIASLFTIAKIWKQPKYPSMDECIEYKENVVYTYTMESYSTITKNEILPSATTWIDFEGIMLSE